MLSKKWRYVGLDFETTGLDRKKDEPIQVGIVEYDFQGNVVDQYQTFIFPKKEISELKGIVNFMTGIKLEDLLNAPKIEDISESILKFFDKNTRIIGHTVDFDVYFLKKYYPQVEFAGVVDTYQRSQNLVHYAPSYALEVLIEYLSQKEDDFVQTLKFFLGEDISGLNFHNAFYDAKMSFVLFFYFVKYLNKVTFKYPVLNHFLRQDSFIFGKLFDFCGTSYNPDIKLPALERLMPRNLLMQKNSDSIDINQLETCQKYYVGNLSFRDLLKNLLPNKNIIIAFSHKQKLDMAKKTLFDMGLKNVGFIRGDQIINSKVFDRFLNKLTFSESEIFFILKYSSHLFQGYGVLDLRTDSDYRIFSLLKDNRESQKYPIVLTTHGGLFSFLSQKNHIYGDYSIVFCDLEQRYKNYNTYLSRSCDLYFVLNFLEGLLYVYSVRNEIVENKYKSVVESLEEFVNSFQIFMGSLFIETKNLFIGRSDQSISYNPILGNDDFRLTNKLRPKLKTYADSIEKKLLEEDCEQFSSHIAHIQKTFDSVMMVSQRVFDSNFPYFVYQENTQFTNRDEFLENFSKNKSVFLSDFNQNYTYLLKGKDCEFRDFLKIQEIGRLVDFLEKFANDDSAESVFVISSLKHQSQEIFDLIHKRGIHKKLEIIAENIIGGIGKCVFKAKGSKKKVMIGSYHFALWLISEQVYIDKVINFNIRGSQEEYLLQDLKWYMI